MFLCRGCTDFRRNRQLTSWMKLCLLQGFNLQTGITLVTEFDLNFVHCRFDVVFNPSNWLLVKEIYQIVSDCHFIWGQNSVPLGVISVSLWCHMKATFVPCLLRRHVSALLCAHNRLNAKDAYIEKDFMLLCDVTTKVLLRQITVVTVNNT